MPRVGAGVGGAPWPRLGPGYCRPGPPNYPSLAMTRAQQIPEELMAPSPRKTGHAAPEISKYKRICRRLDLGLIQLAPNPSSPQATLHCSTAALHGDLLNVEPFS